MDVKLNPTLLKHKNNFFSKFEEGDIKKILKHGVINRHSEGDVIFWQGDEGEAMYIILSGEVEILLEDQDIEEVVAILGPGEIFGEGSFASGAPRTAKALSTKDTYLYVLASEHLKKLIDKDSQVAANMLLELLKIVCERLKITNTRLSN